MVEFRDVVKKYAGTDEALGVPAGTVGGIPVVTPDDLGPAAAMTPAEVVTDEDAQAALSGAFRQGSIFIPTGRWAVPPGVASTPGTRTAGILHYLPMYFDGVQALDRIAVNVTIAGDVSSVVRMGIYDDAGGVPGDLIVDAGTVGTGTTGEKEAVIDVEVQGRVWLCAVAQNVTSDATFTRWTPISIGESFPTLSNAVGAPRALASTGVSGALPSSAPAIFTATGAFLIAVRGG